MLCKNCEHFKIRQKPLKVGRNIYDCGMAECTKHNLIVEFTYNAKIERLECIEGDEAWQLN